MIKKLLKIFVCLSIIFTSLAVLGCGGISEEDLPKKSEEYVIEINKNGGFLKPEDFDYAPRYNKAFSHAENIINKLSSEDKEYLLNNVVEWERFEGLNPIQVPHPQYKTVMIPMKASGTSYIRKYPENRTPIGTVVSVVWQKIDDNWVVYDMMTGTKQHSHMNKLEGLEFAILGIIGQNMHLEDKYSRM